MDFNSDQPAPVAGPVTKTISIGYEHEIVGDELVLSLDAAGEPIPRTYTVNVAPTPREVMARTANLPPETILDLTSAIKASDGDALIQAMLRALGAVAGPWVDKVAEDRTANPAAVSQLVGWLVDLYGLTELLQLSMVLATADDAPQAQDGDDNAPFGEPADEETPTPAPSS